MHEDILADRCKNLLTYGLKQNCLEIGAYHRNDKDTCVNSHAEEDLVHLEALCLHKLNDVTHNKGRNYIVANGEGHNKTNEKKLFPMWLYVNEDTLDNFRVLHMAVKADGLLLILHHSISYDENYRKYI